MEALPSCERRNSDGDLGSTPAGSLPPEDPGIKGEVDLTLFRQNTTGRTVAALMKCHSAKTWVFILFYVTSYL